MPGFLSKFFPGKSQEMLPVFPKMKSKGCASRANHCHQTLLSPLDCRTKINAHKDSIESYGLICSFELGCIQAQE